MNILVTKMIYSILNKLITAFPHALLISIIMSMGTIIQKIFTQLIISESTTIYDTINEGQIAISQTNFIQFFTSYFWSWFLIPSFIIIYFSFRGKTLKKILIYLTILIFINLMITDYLFSDVKKLDNHLSNIISNIIGSPIIAIIVVLSLDTGYTINQYFEINHTTYRKLINALTAITYGFVIAFIVYIIHVNMYTVTTSKIDLSIKAPVNGIYMVDHDKNRTSEKSYGFLSSISSNVKKIDWTGFSNNFSLTWEKHINKKSHIYNAEIRVLDSCFQDKDKIVKAKSAPPTYIMKNINKFKLIADNGPLEMYTIQNSSYSSDTLLTSSKNEDKVMFWLEKSPTKGYDLTRLMHNSDQIKHSSWSSKISYVLTFTTFDSNMTNSKTPVKSREISLESDNDVLKISLIPPTQINSKVNTKYHCQVFNKSQDGTYNLKSITNEVILTFQEIEEISTPNTIFSDLHNLEETNIEGFKGFMEAKEIEGKKLSAYIHDGTLNFLTITAPIQKLYIDGKEYIKNLSSNNIYIGHASLIGNVTSEGFLNFTGNAKAIYINQERANLSRWEKLDLTYKYTALFSIIGGILLIILKRFKYISNYYSNQDFI